MNNFPILIPLIQQKFANNTILCFVFFLFIVMISIVAHLIVVNIGTSLVPLPLTVTFFIFLLTDYARFVKKH